MYESAESLNFNVEYELDGVQRTYKPDFYLPSLDVVIEVKPSHLLENSMVLEKIKTAKQKFSNFLVMTEKEIPRISKEEYEELISSGCIKLLNKI